MGVGLGWSPQEFALFGEDSSLHGRAEKLDEGLTILTGLWTGEPFSFQGQHYQLNEVCFQPRPLQTPRIPIWACGTWPTAKAPFRRAAQYDGIVAILDPIAKRAIQPEEVQAIQTYLQQHRPSAEAFDIVVILWSDGERSPQASAETLRYSDAGVTWWLEDLSLERFATVGEVRARLQKGPPGHQATG